MNKIKSVLKEENIEIGYLYFFIHFIVEVLCFYSLNKIMGNSVLVWIVPFFYDMFAFVPQGIIGNFCDKHPKFDISKVGIILLILGFVLINYNLKEFIIIKVLILCLGNAILHVTGAESTLRTSNGKMASSAIFVSGGAFGVVTGKLLASKTSIPYLAIALVALLLFPLTYLVNKRNTKPAKKCNNFNYAKNINPYIVILLATLVVMVRGYIGYGIPTTWNKTVIQTIMLYAFMGIGKALGGILIDLIGMRKTAIISTLIAIPFLIFGDNIMIVSLIGILFFSMTMAITLGLLVSVLKSKPGLAFGYTTLGLFLGTAPIFFVKITSQALNIGMICISSLICCLMLSLIIRGDKDEKLNK